jgi:hypothetical protein
MLAGSIRAIGELVVALMARIAVALARPTKAAINSRTIFFNVKTGGGDYANIQVTKTASRVTG